MRNDMQASAGTPLRTIENQVLFDLIAEYGDTVAGKKQVAKKLGISLSTLYRRLQEMNQRA